MKKRISILSIASFFLTILLALICFSACNNSEEKDDFVFQPLKTVVFADVQLEQENFGNTRNAYLALRNHFNYAKSIGAEVVFMPGDVVNKADESCYQAYEKALRSVYGFDENDYPEMIFCMGNHEWWGSDEKDISTAVSLFKKYARIETKNLVKKSEISYYLDKETTLPTYYKVIKGIPFLVISGNGSDGRIESKLKDEISGWLEEISELPSVKLGGPIYVAYHYPISRVTYKGENANTVSNAINDLFKNYPNAIVFTGDTHFSGVNERTINQTNYTAINLGSSSYSRNSAFSATNMRFDNVSLNYKDKNLLNGEAGFKCEYTPTLHVLTLDDAGVTTIERFFTADKIENVKKIGIDWQIPLIKDKSQFVYTNERIRNTEWANILYGADGLTWSSGETVRYNEDNGKMFVCFGDVSDHNCAEHYRIEIKDSLNAENATYYDLSGHYYKYDDNAHVYHTIIEDLPAAAAYTVTVTAYDFFDNPSLNNLVSETEDETLSFPDAIDVAAAKTYSDVSRRVNYEITAEESNSALEYYYRGISAYSEGLMLCQIVFKNDVGVNEYLSVEDWSDATVTLKIKNPNDFDIYLGLCVIASDKGAQRLIDDFSAAHRKVVKANSEWTTVEWRLKSEYNFNFNSGNVERITLKATADSNAVDAENGYEINLFIDDLDIIG